MNRKRFEPIRASVTHTVTIGGKVRLTFTVGEFPDGSPGEVFLDEYEIEDEKSTVNRTLDQWCIAISLLLQTGYDLKALVMKFGHARYEPSGFTGDPDIKEAKSVTDYIIRWMGKRYLPEEGEEDEPRRT